MWERLIRAADAGEQLYLNSDLRRDIRSLARSNDLLRMRIKMIERERDSLQVRLIKQAVTADELKAAPPKMLRQRDDYRKHKRKSAK